MNQQKSKTIVDEAILDAIAIREAAERTAEKKILKRYNIDVKQEIQKLLEQEVPMVDQSSSSSPNSDPMAALGSSGAALPSLPGSSPMGLGTEADLPIDPEKAGSDSENDSILSQLEYAFKDGEVIDGKKFPEGIVEINLDSLNEGMFNSDPLYELDSFDLDEDKLFEPQNDEKKGNDPMMLGEDEYDDVFGDINQDDSIDDDELEYVADNSYEKARYHDTVNDVLRKKVGKNKNREDALRKGNLEKTLPNDLSVSSEEYDDESFDDDSFKFDSYEDVDSEYDISDDEDASSGGSSVVPIDLLDDEGSEFDDDLFAGVEDDDLSDLDLLGEPENEDPDEEVDEVGSSDEEDDVLNELSNLSDDDFPEEPVKTSDEKKKEKEMKRKSASKKGLNETKVNINHNQTSSANRRGRSKAEVQYEEEMTDLQNDSKKKVDKAKKLNAAIILKLKEAVDLIGNLKKSTEKLKKENQLIQERFESSQNLNGKLLFINKALMDSSLNERQKERIVEAISKAKNKGDAQLIFESLMTAKDAAGRKDRRTIEEGLRGNSSSITMKQNLTSATLMNESNDHQYERWQKLAGTKK